MNGRERILTALSLGQADRVPHMELAYNEASIIGIARHFTDELLPDKPACDMTPEELLNKIGPPAVRLEGVVKGNG